MHAEKLPDPLTGCNCYECEARRKAKMAASQKAHAAGKNSSPLTGSAASPITYRMLHEHVAGMGLEESFFALSGIDPDAPVKCNCNWDQGHEAHCDIVSANSLIRQPPNVGR